MSVHVSHRAKITRIGTTLLAVMFILLGLSEQAFAQSETDADFQKYCRTRHPGSFYQRTGVEHHCKQGATLQSVDLAYACELTTGSRSFRRLDWRVLCEAGPGGDGSPSTAVGEPLGAQDYRRYCLEEFPGSSYEKRAENWGVVHYCRRPGATGGFTLQNVDLAQACRLTRGVANYELSQNQVYCTEAAGAPPVANPPTPGPGPVPRPGPLPFPPPRRDPPPDPGQPPGPVPGPGPGPSPGPSPAPGAGSDPEEQVSQACAGVGGEWKEGTPDEVAKLVQSSDEILRQRLAGCAGMGSDAASCRRQATVEQSVAAYFEAFAYWQCNVAVVRTAQAHSADKVETAREDACRIQPTLDELKDKANANGGAMAFAPHMMIIQQFQLHDMCK